MPRFSLLWMFCACAAWAQTPPAPEPPAPQAPLSSAAERVYDMAKPRILQVRTLLRDQDSQASVVFVSSDCTRMP